MPSPFAFRLGAIVLLIAVASTSTLAAPILHPRTYASASDEYALRVEPSSPDGNGPASYRMTRGDDEVWAREHEFTLWLAKVTDEGSTVGVAYNGGLQGIFTKQPNGASYLMVVILGPEGEVHWIDRELRRHPPFHSNPPAPYWPTAEGIVVVPERSSFLVPVSGVDDDDSRDQWWIYHLNKRGRLASVVPDEPEHRERGFHRNVFLEAVPGAPLVLSHWLTWDSNEAGERRIGAQFSVLTLEGRSVWRVTYPAEYAEFGDRFGVRELREQGYEQAGVTDSGCWIHSFEGGERLSFRIVEDAEAPMRWRVEELGREEGRPQPAPQESEADAAPFEKVTLREIGRIELDRTESRPSPVKGLRGFVCDGDQGFALMHLKRDPSRLWLTLLDAGGDVRAEYDVTPPRGAYPYTTRSPDGRWVLNHSGKQRDAADGPRVWIFNPENRGFAVRPLPNELDIFGAVHELANGLIVGAGLRKESRQPEVFAIDEQGEIVWSSPVDVFDIPEHLAITSREEIVVLEKFPGGLVWLSAGGKELRRIKLETALGRKPNYPSGVYPDVDGGVVFHDFNGTPPVYRFGADGKLKDSFHPAYEDGRQFKIHGGVRAGPDGRLWTSDGHALLGLDDEGVVRTILGPRPGGANLDHIADIAVGQDGTIYAVNGRDGVVHAFDPSGKRTGLMTPAPDDFKNEFDSDENLTIDAHGVIYLHEPRRAKDERGYLRFDAHGNRLGFERFKFDPVREHWFFKPGANERWVVGYHEIRLLNANGRRVKRIRKRANGDWLGRTHDAAVAPDGSLAVLVTDRDWGWNQPSFLCIISSAGDVRATWELEGPAIAKFSISFDGTSVLLSDQDGFLVVDARTGSRSRASYPADVGARWVWTHISQPNPAEIWMRAGSEPVIRRMAVVREP